MIKQLERRRYYIIKKLTAMKSLTSSIDFRSGAKAKLSNKFLNSFVVILSKINAYGHNKTVQQPLEKAKFTIKLSKMKTKTKNKKRPPSFSLTAKQFQRKQYMNGLLKIITQKPANHVSSDRGSFYACLVPSPAFRMPSFY